MQQVTFIQEVVAAAEVPVSAVHRAVLQVVGQTDAPLPQQETCKDSASYMVT